MAPVNKIKTYGRSSKSIVNNSVDAINLLFAKNRAKSRQNKKRKLVIKELPPRLRGETLLVDDSLHVSTEDTFDKIAKGNKGDNFMPKISAGKNGSNRSRSFKQVNNFYSPIMTRRRTRTTSVAEISDSSTCNKSEGKRNKSNKSCSIIPHFLEPTVDKIDFSLEVEKVPKVVPTSLSYIKIPNVKNEEMSNNSVREDTGASKKDISFDPIFTKTFREKQMIHCSTPLMTMRTKDKIVNHTISPIKNATFPNKSRIKNTDIETQMSILQNSSLPSKSASKNANDWKLQSMPKVLLSRCSDIRDYQYINGSESVQPSNILNINSVSLETEKGAQSHKSFITLRKRKILKSDYSEMNRRSKKSRKIEVSNYSVNNTGKNVTTSLAEFNAFVDRINDNETNLGQQSHSLYDFESFVARSENLLSVSDEIDSVYQQQSDLRETPINFITKRRRRLTDSCLCSSEKLKPYIDTSQRHRRRYSLQASTDEVSMKDLVVRIPKINVKFYQEKTETSTNEDINSLIRMIDRGNTYFQSGDRISNDLSEGFKGFSNANDLDSVYSVSEFLSSNNFDMKNLIVNITKRDLEPNLNNDNSRNSTKILENSCSLFDNTSSQVINASSRSLQNQCSPMSDPNKNKNVLKRTPSSQVNHRKSIRAKNSSSINTTLPDQNSNSSKGNRLSNLKSSLKIIRNKVTTQGKINEHADESISDVINSTPDSTLDNKSCNNNIIAKNSNFPVEDFENFFINMTNRSDSSKNASNKEQPTLTLGTNKQTTDSVPEYKENIAIVSETQSLHAANSLKRTNSAEEFEKFYINAMRSSSESDSNQFLMNDYNLEDDSKIEKLLTVDLVKSPWREKFNKYSVPKVNSTVVDLTDSVDENYSRQSSGDSKHKEETKVKSPTEFIEVHEISDIIESSVQETYNVDCEGFKIPSSNNTRKGHSKTLLLKAGKLWRRSLSIYKKSSMMLSLMNEESCIAGDGSYCTCPKCSVSRESQRLSHRRCSVKIVPASTEVDPQKEASILESYAFGYVSDQILDDNLEDNLRSLSISQRSSVIQNSAPVTARELVLRRCGQADPIPFEECYTKSVLQHCQKIGEGVYGEVFLFRNPNGGTSVMKVIPIEGDQIVNGERQKKFEEIFSEIIIAQELSSLRNNKENTTSGFSEVQKVQCVQGRYPEKLLDLWDLYDETRGSENDSPEIFGEDQLYIVLQLANGGQDLEAFIFNNSLQAYTMFQQVACALAIAEEQLHFEHRDLHWGNILLSTVDKTKKVNFRLNAKNYEIMTRGVEVAIIDFTLSRIEYDGVVIFNDLALDPDLFTAEGDYQFEIYKLMQKKNGNNWQRFEPYSNVLWLHYTLDKAITALRYKNIQTKVHKEYIGKLKQLKKDILNFASVKEFVINNF